MRNNPAPPAFTYTQVLLTPPPSPQAYPSSSEDDPYQPDSRRLVPRYMPCQTVQPDPDELFQDASETRVASSGEETLEDAARILLEDMMHMPLVDRVLEHGDSLKSLLEAQEFTGWRRDGGYYNYYDPLQRNLFETFDTAGEPYTIPVCELPGVQRYVKVVLRCS